MAHPVNSGRSGWASTFSFTEQHRQHILDVLNGRHIGDEESREAFIRAAEGTLRAWFNTALTSHVIDKHGNIVRVGHVLPSPTSPVVRSKLDKIEKAARRLAAVLRQTDEEVRRVIMFELAQLDPSIPNDFLNVIHAQADKLARACPLIHEELTPPTGPKNPLVHLFIHWIGLAFQTHLHEKPTPDRSGAFAEVLAAIKDAIEDKLPAQLRSRFPISQKAIERVIAPPADAE